MNDLNLSEKEKKELMRLENNQRSIGLYKIIGILLIAVSIFLFFADKDNIYEALSGVIIGWLIILQQNHHKRYYLIINKMRDYIKELKNNREAL